MTKVMLIEDDATMRSLLKTLLEIEGFQVHVEEIVSVIGALKALHAENPDLLLLDVHLKDIDGITIMKEIRKDAALKDLRVLMASGMDLESNCLEAGANAFYVKPYAPEDLINWLHSA